MDTLGFRPPAEPGHVHLVVARCDEMDVTRLTPPAQPADVHLAAGRGAGQWVGAVLGAPRCRDQMDVTGFCGA
jgi:hypothetical protein